MTGSSSFSTFIVYVFCSSKPASSVTVTFIVIIFSPVFNSSLSKTSITAFSLFAVPTISRFFTRFFQFSAHYTTIFKRFLLRKRNDVNLFYPFSSLFVAFATFLPIFAMGKLHNFRHKISTPKNLKNFFRFSTSSPFLATFSFRFLPFISL